ncbi:hypothetical protein C8R46DRAFT_922078, partial [Mycena filopes]
GKRGPKSTSRDHFHDPIAVKCNGEPRWEFKCRHCTKSCTFPRTVKRDKTFKDEPKQPNIGNLATHLRTDHDGPATPIPGATPVGETRGISAASAKIMADYLAEGKLNPAVKPTQKGFLTVFAAWICEDDLPFTTGETGGIRRLFEYMKSKFLLPSDTTVRNTLARIYTEMHDRLKADLEAIDRWVIERAELRPLLLSEAQWKLLEALGGILKIFTQVTLQMSKSSTPTLPWVLPMYEHMLKHLQATRDDGKLLQPLRVAATAGLDKLNIYYEKARGCQFNVIATSILNDEKERQNKAVILFEHAFESYKKTYDDERAAQRTAAANSHPHARPSLSFLDDVCMLGPEDDDDAVLPTDAIGELTLFWAAYRTHGRGDRDRPLSWWKVFVYPLPSSTLDPHSVAGIRTPLPHHFTNGARLFGDSRDQCLCGAPLLTITASVP